MENANPVRVNEVEIVTGLIHAVPDIGEDAMKDASG
jgi:hypothetical protein